MGTAGSRGDVGKASERLVARARDDAAFRKRLLEHPRETLERELRIKLPKDLVLRVGKGPSGKLELVTSMQPTGELTDAQLAAVAGGSPTDGAATSEAAGAVIENTKSGGESAAEMNKLALQTLYAAIQRQNDNVARMTRF